MSRRLARTPGSVKLQKENTVFPFLQISNDIKTFFGDYPAALQQGEQMLFMIGEPDILEEHYNECIVGWLDEQAFYIHMDLVQEVAPILRIYIGCAQMLYGDLCNADVVKLHKRTGKVTFLKYDDFAGKPLPELAQRIKINLQTQTIDVFDYGNDSNCQLLYFKERFVARDHPDRDKWEPYSKKLRKLGLSEEMGFGPCKEELMKPPARQQGADTWAQEETARKLNVNDWASEIPLFDAI